MSEAVRESGLRPGGYDAFICYNEEDEDEARRLKTGLESGHLRVFEASSSLHPGDSWMKEVASAIGSAKAALVLLGKGGAKRWAELELEELLREHKKRQMRIIPVLVSGATNDPDVPWLGGFTRVDLRRHYRARLGQLLATLEGASEPPFVFPPPPPIERRVRIAVAAVLAAALAAGAVIYRWRAGVEAKRQQAAIARQQEEIAHRIDGIIQNSDWPAVKDLAGAGSQVVRPIDEALLARYRGSGTTNAVSTLLEIAHHEPQAVCPLLAGIVDIPAGHGYPLLTIEEVLSQIVHSPCAAHVQVQNALTGAAAQVRAALGPPADLRALQERLDPRLDCSGLERLRQLLALPGPPACMAVAP
jgi:hypothetical protein